MQNSKYVYLETFGCTANQNNSEILKGILTQSGYQITNNQNIADIIILNTCIVKQKTEDKIKRKIQDLIRLLKKDGDKRDTNKLIIITGCMPETDAEQIKKLNPNTILLGTHHFKDIINLIKDHQDNKLKDKKYLDYQNEEKLLLPKIPKNKLISICQISEGCLGNCSFCKTRLAKGKLFSYSEKDIIKTIESDLKQGAKEVWITSQDNANYGIDKSSSYKNKNIHKSRVKLSIQERYKDNSNQKLPELLKKILNLNHKFKLRLGMMDPNNVLSILDELIEIYKHPKMYKFLHIPIQSGSNKILKHMNRLYTIEQVKKIISKFKEQIPDITISTDIIIGYPTSTQKDFIQNLDFIKQIKPDVFNLSKMSIHKGTNIYEQIKQEKNQLKQEKSKTKRFNKIPDIKMIHKRTKEIMQLHRQTALQNKKKFLNKTIKVFVNKKISENFFEARDENYNIVLINSKDNLLGKNIKVKIKDIGVHHMIGKLIN